MKTNRLTLLFIIFMVIPSVAKSGWLGGPKDYDDCVLESMKGVTSNVAANAIKKSCREKFPIRTRLLNSHEMQLLDANNGDQNKGYFFATILNKNKNLTISSVTIMANDHDNNSGTYTESIDIGPMESQTCTFFPLSFWVSNWRIVSAKCYD